MVQSAPATDPYHCELVMRRIAILPSWYPTDESPVDGIFVHQQAIALSAEYHVGVLHPRIVPWPTLISGHGGVSSELDIVDNIPVYRERAIALVPPRWSMLPYYRYLAAAQRTLQRFIAAQGKPDLIHAHVVLPGGWAAVQLGRRHSIPVVLTEHSEPFSMHLTTALTRRLTRETLLGADVVVVVGTDLAEQVRRFCDEVEPQVVGNVVRTDYFAPAGDLSSRGPQRSTTFLTIGILTKRKAIQHLLRAARLLVDRELSTFQIVIGGDGPERDSIERMQAALGLSELVHLRGLMSQSQVRDAMQSCDVFVLPSLHETFGVVVAEAMACGKPVIATRCGGPEHFVTPETGVLVEPGHPSALADAMEQFLKRPIAFDPNVIRESTRSRYGEEAFLANISAVYERVWATKPVAMAL